MSAITVACCQVALAVGEGERNRATLQAAIRDAAGRGAQVVVVPELAPSGYVFAETAEARALAEPVDGPTLTAWSALAAELGVVIAGGFPELGPGGDVHNSAALVDPDGVRAVYRKAHLWDRETLVFTPGSEPPPVVNTAFGRLGLVVCYDLEFPEWVRLPALAGAELLCAPTNWPAFPRPRGERPVEIVRVQANASVNRVFVAACDRVGAERGVDWVGGSVVVDPDGYPVAGPLASPRSEILLASCALEDARAKGISDHNDVHGDRRPDLYARALTSVAAPGPA
jgi:predicted amidohydrolase